MHIRVHVHVFLYRDSERDNIAQICNAVHKKNTNFTYKKKEKIITKLLITPTSLTIMKKEERERKKKKEI